MHELPKITIYYCKTIFTWHEVITLNWTGYNYRTQPLGNTTASNDVYMNRDNRHYIWQPLRYLNFSSRQQCHKSTQSLFTVMILVWCGSSDFKLLLTASLELFMTTGKLKTSGGHIVQFPPQVASVMNEIRTDHSGHYLVLPWLNTVCINVKKKKKKTNWKHKVKSSQTQKIMPNI